MPFKSTKKNPLKKAFGLLQISIAENVKFGPRGTILEMEKGKTLTREEIPTSLENSVTERCEEFAHVPLVELGILHVNRLSQGNY
jgi:hypothetical protein